MRCPKCTDKMEAIIYGEIEIDQCIGCGGLWFDSGEAEQLSNTWIAQFIDTGDVKTGHKMDDVLTLGCPRCGELMKAHLDMEKSQVFFEVCHTHGKYFDAGEFTMWATNQYL